MSEAANSVKKWALYVFFGANVPEAEVREAAVQNLLQMATVGSSDYVAVAAQLHLPGEWAYRYVMPKRLPGSDPIVLAPTETIRNANSADPNTIIKFFIWAARECPADNTMLVVWGHGYGLDDYLPLGGKPNTTKILTREYVETRGNEQTAESTQRSADAGETSKSKDFPSATQAEQILDTRYSNASLFNVIFDECSLDVLPNAQLGAAASACKEELSHYGRVLTILGLDACAMAMAEVWCELQAYASIGIASEAQEPDASFPYDRFLARLILQPNASPQHVAKMMVDAYVESYAYQCDTFVTLSSCNLTGFGELTVDIAQLVKELTRTAKDPEARRIIFRARDDSPIFDPDGFIDLGRFCEILMVTLPDTAVCKACDIVLKKLKCVVTYARYSPLDPTLRISQTTGLSVWFPPWLEDPFVGIPEQEASIAYLVNGYDETAFAKSTHWDKFLKSMWHTRGHCPESIISTLAER